MAPSTDALLSQYGCRIVQTHPNSIWRKDLVYPDEGIRLEVRPMTPDDDRREAEFFAAQTLQERLMRFMGATKDLPPSLLRRLTHINFNLDFAIVAVDRFSDEMAGVARYVRDEEDLRLAHVAVAVLNRYQRRGLARYLVAAVIDAARHAGVTTLSAEIRAGNHASWQLFDKVANDCGVPMELVAVDGDVNTYHICLEATGPRQSDVDTLKTSDTKHASSMAPPSFSVDDSRHPRSLWRHDLVFPSGMRVEVRPADVDDAARIRGFEISRMQSGGSAKQVTELSMLLDFTAGFCLVAIDMASDELVGVASYQRGADGSSMHVFTAPNYTGLGIADFLAAELLRAAQTEVVLQPSAL